MGVFAAGLIDRPRWQGRHSHVEARDVFEAGQEVVSEWPARSNSQRPTAVVHVMPLTDRDPSGVESLSRLGNTFGTGLDSANCAAAIREP